MMTTLDIHAASPDELAAAHRNVFDIWSKGLPLEEHLRLRLESPKHGLANWYVGTLAGQVVVSLGCYPLVLSYRGELVPGFSIGSVYTVKEFRGHGFAPQLLEWVERQQRDVGAQIGLLYSDINPDYYARLGYVLCPSLEGWREVSDVVLPDTLAHHLVEISATDRWPELGRLYDTYHGAMPLSIARNAAYWRSLLERYTEDRFFALVDRNDNWHGYVRIGVNGQVWRITDYALADQSLDLAEALYAACFEFARASDAKRFGGWLPDHPSARQFFDLTPRHTEITMLKSLDATRPLDDELIELTSRFCEIDHV
jgi:GNAT superfamily N-acetyltransferase